MRGASDFDEKMVKIFFNSFHYIFFFSAFILADNGYLRRFLPDQQSAVKESDLQKRQ